MTIDERVQMFLQMLARTSEDECDCSLVFELMDEAVELQASGADLASVMPQIEQHFALCGCCRQEYEMLKQIVAGEDDASALNRELEER